jgi:hypothetical protein
LVTGEGGGSEERLHDGNTGGTISGRPEEWWRAPTQWSWSGGELEWRSLW